MPFAKLLFVNLLTLILPHSRCPDCIEAFTTDPLQAVRWKEEEAETMSKLRTMGMEM